MFAAMLERRAPDAMMSAARCRLLCGCWRHYFRILFSLLPRYRRHAARYAAVTSSCCATIATFSFRRRYADMLLH